MGRPLRPRWAERSTNSREYAIDFANRANDAALDNCNGLLGSGHGVIEHHFRPFHLDFGAGARVGQQLVDLVELLFCDIEDGLACGPDLLKMLFSTFDCALRDTDYILNIGQNRADLLLKIARHNKKSYQHPRLNNQCHGAPQ